MRRGKPAHDCAGERRSNGHLVWKFNNTWPQFYCGLVDYYGECHIPYYSARRAFAPFLLTFDVQDHIYVWGVNDTPGDMTGTLTVKVFNLEKSAVTHELQCPATVLAGQSTICTNLDAFRHFRRDSILYASFESGGKEVGRAVGTVDLERHLPFPQARLTLHVQDDTLTVTTDQFARCVELSGLTPEGDAFGWHFEDNYFDLLPFESKTVRILGKHQSGTLAAKAHYSAHIASVDWHVE